MNASIHEVAVTLVEALIIVMLVIFAFLGSPRSVLIPVIAIPLSLVGTLAIMLALGFSINLLTLLALVLAIGLVVDDAIIVVENVNRHLEGGMPPLPAAIHAARELGTPIIAMTVVLLAVYVPIGFQGGLTGALFTEFVFTLAGAVTVSAVIALTLSPMMCSKLLKPHRGDHAGLGRSRGQVHRRALRALAAWYQHRLERSLHFTPVTAVFVVLVLISIALLYRSAKSELAPQEDQGFLVRAGHLRAGCDAAAQAPVRRRGIPADQCPKGHQIPSSRSRRPAQSFDGTGAHADLRRGRARTRSSTVCSRSLNGVAGQRRSQCSSFPRSPARAACRCNSRSRPPSPHCA